MKYFFLVFSMILGFSSNVYAQSWDEIPPESRKVLRPLRSTWEGLPANQRQQWLSRTSQLQRLNREQLANAQERMAEWASLSQKQRAQVQRKLENGKINNAIIREDTWNSFISR